MTVLNCGVSRAVCFVSIFSAAKAAEKPRPNVLFLMVDEMRWDAMSCAGHPVVKTPNLDRLAENSVRFSRAYSASPVCVPARNSLFTSRYTPVHGVLSNKHNVNAGEIFLPSIFQYFGYKTAISGKLHFQPKGPDYGFDEFYSYRNEGTQFENSYDFFITQKYGDPVKNRYSRKPGSQIYASDPLGRDYGEYAHDIADYETSWIGRYAVEFIRRQNTGRPWFLFTSFNRPHSPYVLPEPYFSMYRDKEIPLPEIPQEIINARPGMPRNQQRQHIANKDMLRDLTQSYLASITFVDDQIGLILNELKQRGMEEDTIIVFTSDHGNMLGERGRFFKSCMYDGSARIPLIISVPEKWLPDIKPERNVQEIVELIDIMPTLLDLAGLKNSVSGMQGESLKELLCGNAKNWKNEAYSRLWEDMLVSGNYKYIYSSKENRWEVYDLAADPLEQNNLAGAAGFKEKISQAKDKMNKRFSWKPGALCVDGMEMPEYAKILRPKFSTESDD